MMRFLSLLIGLMMTIMAEAQTLDGTWKGILQAGPQQLTLVIHINAQQQTATLDVVEQSAFQIPLTVRHLSEDSINVVNTQMVMIYEGKLSDGKLLGTFRQRLVALKLDLEPGDIILKRPQEPSAPFPYSTEEVTFCNAQADVKLAGTLTYPVGYRKGKKVPVVLMVTGSGPENRDEEIFRHKPFLVLADWLARQGIASLRYDDRGVGESTGTYEGATTMDFAEDAKAGISFLKDRKEFSKVGILGHSEGGAIGYMLGSEKIPDFIVSLAGPAYRIDTMMMVQLNLLGKVQGAKTDMAQTPEDAKRLLMRGKKEDKWLETFLTLDMTEYVSKTRCPVLALTGENDLNVPVSVNNPALEKWLPHNKRNVIKVYSGLSHLFHHNPTGNPTLAASIEETIAQEVLEDICDWIKRL